jgi:hypothetical protein
MAHSVLHIVSFVRYRSQGYSVIGLHPVASFCLGKTHCSGVLLLMAKVESRSNFDFLSEHGPMLLDLAIAAERAFSFDPNTSLMKLRQLGEALAQHMAATPNRRIISIALTTLSASNSTNRRRWLLWSTSHGI